MLGLVTKGIGGFYYVKASDNSIYVCRGRGNLKVGNGTIAVGDMVDFEIIGPEEGVIESIRERKNLLIRPPISNVDVMLLTFAVKKPKLNKALLDRFLISVFYYGIKPVICFSKSDLLSEREKEELRKSYSSYDVIFVSSLSKEGVDEVKKQISGKRAALAGPSGCGKSTLINILAPKANMEIGEISRKTQRGKHTTRHVELFMIDSDTYIFDTPGFTSIDLPKLPEGERLSKLFPDIDRLAEGCRFDDCNHYKEPDCNVIRAVETGTLKRERYDVYLRLYKEIMGIDKKN